MEDLKEKQYAKLVFVKQTATGHGLNQEMSVEENDDRKTATVTKGRVGIRIGREKPTRWTIPMSQWDMFLEQKKQQGYTVVSTKKMDAIKVVKKNETASIRDENVRQIVDALRSYTAQAMEENYTVKVENISDEMLSLGEEILSGLSTGYKEMSVARFNIELERLFTVIPRRIDKLSKLLAKDRKDFEEILEREQETFELMRDAVKQVTHEVQDDFLQSYGLEWRPATVDEENEIKALMGSNSNRFHRAWRITNTQTQKKFDSFCRETNLTMENHGVERLFHGSKHENWWSIITNGLVIDPERFGASICGKAYGYGTYFAPDAVKSFGYTSIRGSKWAQGSSKCGYMGIYMVATGDKAHRYPGTGGCDNTLSYNKLQTIQPGALCTWAECRYSGFLMDEVIVYRDIQDTIEFLIEVE